MANVPPPRPYLDHQTELHGLIGRATENLKKVGTRQMTKQRVQARIEALKGNWNKFQSNHLDLMRIRGELSGALEKELNDHPYFKDNLYADAEELFLNAEEDMPLIYDELCPQAPAISSAFVDASVYHHEQERASHTRRLPRIDLPKFGGDLCEWSTFRDLFSSLVGSSTELTLVEKLQYLKLSLTGVAAQRLQNIAVTSDNFQRAWESLVEYYENKRVLVDTYIAALFAAPKVTQESAVDIEKLSCEVTQALNALEAIDRPVENWDDLIVHLVVRKLDPASVKEWEREVGTSTDPPTWPELRAFLTGRIRSLQAFERATATSATVKLKSKPQFSGAKTHHITTESQSRCALCSSSHFIAACSEYQKQSAEQRRNIVAQKRLCFNCLGAHLIKDCRVKGRCKSCSSKHHTSLHLTDSKSPSAITPMPGPTPSATASQPASVNSVAQAEPFVGSSSDLLATAVVNIVVRSGEMCEARALIDQGSQVSLVTENLVQRLKLSRAHASVSVVCVGDRGSQSTNGEVRLKLCSRVSSFSCTVDALVLPRLTGYLPSQEVRGQRWEHLNGLTLADPDFLQPRKIDLILGVRLHAQILEEGLIKGSPDDPIAQKTALGWIVSGPVNPRSSSNFHSFHCSVDRELVDLVRRFAAQEEEFITNVGELSGEEAECESHYRESHKRDADGRYVVRLPLRCSLDGLGDSYVSALRLLTRLETRFRKEPEFYEAYSQFLKVYEEQGHMTKCSTEVQPARHFYLPHHGVLRESSSTTKLRVVFNGSKKTNTGSSLNDYLHTGPKVLADLVDVILRWRVNQFVFSTDIVKMFRQILVAPEDRDLQRILWRPTLDSPVTAYQLNTVTYGLGPAPYLAIRTLRQLAEDEGHRFPLAVPVILNETYVDNIHSGGNTVEEAQEKVRQTRDLLMAGGFPLQQWIANHDEILDDIPESQRATIQSKSFDDEPLFHALGLTWQPNTDSFVFTSGVTSEMTKLSKRTVLSRIAQCFDPLGWLAPIVIRAKIFMQELWTIKIGWDDELPDDFAIRWRGFLEQLPQVSALSVPRWLGLSSTMLAVELHGFSDASQLALGAVVYIRVMNDYSDVRVSLVSAKTKVAPITRDNSKGSRSRVARVTIPRLELAAAVLLVRHIDRIRKTLKLENVPVHLWTDSTVALHWISGHPSRWKDFVRNRVSLVQQTLPEAKWHHVDGVDNPADCASRGLSPQQLHQEHLWWTGPSWLARPSRYWPTSSPSLNADADLEEKQRLVASIQTNPSPQLWDLIERYSRLKTLLKVTAWCSRFIILCRPGEGENVVPTHLTATELNAARSYWIRATQDAYFAVEIRLLSQKKALPSSSPLLRLTPTIDSSGLLRIGGRLRNALLDPDASHPLILPRDSRLTLLILDDVHRATFHGGTQTMLATLRRQYWIIGGRTPVRRFVLRCVTCARQRGNTARQLMGQLPAPRVQPTCPFLHTGVDYAGPFQFRTWRGRSAKTYKGYLVLFVCLATSALHLEVATDYSTEGFLAAYRRFAGRRGTCAVLYSDCGTNFVGADAELRRLFASSSKELQNLAATLAQDGTEWKFNPPSAPHFGGKWEAGVKSVKFHLRRVIGEASLTYEEFTTLLCQIEAVLNSRPLCPISDDPEDLETLTPGHFLIGRALTTVPEPSILNLKRSRLSRWQMLRQMLERFWQRWSSEYLQRLQGISKWQNATQSIKVGYLVLVADERYPPSKWPMARVIDIHPGADGLVRVATVKSQSSTFKRPIVKLCVLPVFPADSTSPELNSANASTKKKIHTSLNNLSN